MPELRKSTDEPRRSRPALMVARINGEVASSGVRWLDATVAWFETKFVHDEKLETAADYENAGKPKPVSRKWAIFEIVSDFMFLVILIPVMFAELGIDTLVGVEVNPKNDRSMALAFGAIGAAVICAISFGRQRWRGQSDVARSEADKHQSADE